MNNTIKFFIFMWHFIVIFIGTFFYSFVAVFLFFLFNLFVTSGGINDDGSGAVFGILLVLLLPIMFFASLIFSFTYNKKNKPFEKNPKKIYLINVAVPLLTVVVLYLINIISEM